MSTRSLALNAYRASLRATGKVFKNDFPTLEAARAQIKMEIRNSNGEKLNRDESVEKIDYLNSISKFLLRNLVQGEKKAGDDKYFLNIHEGTELGDNDTIGGQNRKTKRSTLGANLSGSTGGGCCGGGEIKLQEKTK